MRFLNTHTYTISFSNATCKVSFLQQQQEQEQKQEQLQTKKCAGYVRTCFQIVYDRFYLLTHTYTHINAHTCICMYIVVSIK